ncbi:hypothetical protein HYU15_02835 [Candidatus Woesearchaeota archaeon]|nr:hypothetical protein [Candidatus Woesearchaeota archaeon]
MFIDIVSPKGNEKELIAMASRLGVKGLALVGATEARLAELQKQTGIKLYTAGRGKAGITIAEQISKRTKADILIAGHVLKHSEYRELARKGIAICYPVAELLNADDKPRYLETIIRSIMLCRKHKVKMIAATMASEPYDMRAEQELKSLFLTLGMSTKQAKEAVTGTNEIITKKDLHPHKSHEN